MIEQIKPDDIPKSVDELIKFWSQEGIVEMAGPEPVQADILNYLQWVGYLLGEVERMDRKWAHEAAKNSELQKALEWYADAGNYFATSLGKVSESDIDSGHIARQTIERTKP